MKSKVARRMQTFTKVVVDLLRVDNYTTFMQTTRNDTGSIEEVHN
jgi:hypothetical protein